jgi:hypothetical protein
VQCCYNFEGEGSAWVGERHVLGLESFKTDVNYHDCMALCVLQLMEVRKGRV